MVRWIAIGPETGQIVEVLPRRNQLARRSAVPMPSAHAHEQIIAANVDQIVAVFAAANPRPAWNLLDRYLVSAESTEIPALICLTKMDLVEDRPEAEEIQRGDGGVSGHRVSGGLDERRDRRRAERTR